MKVMYNLKNNILLTIQHSLSQLSKKEYVIADFILQHGKQVMTLSIHELAQQCDVSVATVVRFCRSIGLSGYPELKLALSAQTDADQQTIYEEIAPDDSFEMLKDKLTQRLTSTLSLTNDVLEEQPLLEAVQLIESTSQIIVFGLGASHIAAEDFFQKFSRIGKNVITHSDIHLITTLLSANPENKVLVLISNSGEKTQIEQLENIAKSLQIPVIAVTGNQDSELAKQATVTLLHSALEVSGKIRTAATASLIAQLYVVDMLYYYFLTSNYTKYSEPILRTHDATNLFLK